jgi:hypothetical protein
MIRSIVLFGLVCLVLVGCGGSAQPTAPDSQAIADAVSATVAALPQPEQAPPVEVTRVVEVTREVQVEVTRIVEVTAEPEPTATTEAAAAVEPDIVPAEIFTRTVDISQEEGGVIVAVNKFAIAPFESLGALFANDPVVAESDYWKDMAIVVILDVSVTNGTDQTVNVYPNQGSVVVGNQQAEADIWVSEDVGGEIFAGVTQSGVVLFGLPKPVDVTTLEQIRYIVNAPTNAETWDSLGEDYNLVLPLQ